MSMTERLRQLLDKRGVEWWPMHDVENGYREDRYTEFLVNGRKHVAYEWGCKLQVDMLTPEQAVEATLGRGTCKWEPADFITEGEWWNTSCGESFTWEPDGTPRYCPNCGRRVES